MPKHFNFPKCNKLIKKYLHNDYMKNENEFFSRTTLYVEQISTNQHKYDQIFWMKIEIRCSQYIFPKTTY